MNRRRRWRMNEGLTVQPLSQVYSYIVCSGCCQRLGTEPVVWYCEQLTFAAPGVVGCSYRIAHVHKVLVCVDCASHGEERVRRFFKFKLGGDAGGPRVCADDGWCGPLSLVPQKLLQRPATWEDIQEEERRLLAIPVRYRP
jgi:hypothetical protein